MNPSFFRGNGRVVEEKEGKDAVPSLLLRRVSIPAAICFDRKKFEGRIEPISIRIWIRRRLHRYYIYIYLSLLPSLPFAPNERMDPRQIRAAWIYTRSFSCALFIDRCASDYDRFERRKEKKMNLRNRILRSNRENEEKSGVILANFSLSLIHIIEQEERIVV